MSGDSFHPVAAHCDWLSNATIFPLIEARSQIQAGSLMANIIELMVLVHRTMVHCIFRDVLWYTSVPDYGIRKFKKVKNLHFKIKIRTKCTGWF